MVIPFRLPFAERRRLHRRALRRQRLDQGEVCGLLVADRTRALRLVFIPNTADRPGAYSMRDADVQDARRRARQGGGRLVGFFHSHPVSSAVLSQSDMAESPTNVLHLVYDVCGREARLYRVRGLAGHKTATEIPLIVEKTTRPDGEAMT